ncbi:MAG: CpaD family pilus assembly protein [Pseudomonadota bacterium]
MTSMKDTQAAGSRRSGRMVLTAIGIGCATLVAGCQAHHRDYTQPVPMTDTRAMHPVKLAGEFMSYTLPVSIKDRKLDRKQKREIEAFLHGYKTNGGGPLFVAIPEETQNARAADWLVNDIRNTAFNMGIPDDLLVLEGYVPNAGRYGFPVTMRYQVTKMVLPKCGHWEENVGGPNFANKPYGNFGCSQQRNMAAMLENPNDLRHPRGLDPRYSPRRDNVFERYVEGETTQSAANQDDGGQVAEVGE